MRRYLAEGIGTFALVFVGTGAMIVDDSFGGLVTHPGVALAFGLVVMAMIYALGDVSGAHFNPAVSLGFWLARRLPAREVAPYAAAQCLGALLASGLLRLLFSGHATLGATAPRAGLLPGFALEVVLSFLLMFVILGVASGAKERGIMAGISVGATVCLCSLFAGPVTGASMNPARSLGPAVVAGQLSALWLYLSAPLVGAGLGVLGCRCVREPGCCSGRPL